MNLTSETILAFYEHKNKKILCQIKVKSSKGLTTKNTCRSITPDQWTVYDKKLEKVINTTSDWNDGKCLKFNISPCIYVEVQKSKLSAKTFHICLDSSSGTGNDNQGDIESDFVLECIFDFQQHVTPSSSIDSQEYVPQMESSPEGKQSSPLAYEPYTPSKRQNRAYSFNGIKSSSIYILESTEDTYSPKPLYEIAEVDPLITEDIPKYIPAPIESISTNISYEPRNENNPSLKYKPLKSNLTDNLESEYIPTSHDNSCEKGKDNSPSKRYKSLKSNLNNKLENEYIPTSQEFALTDVPVYIPTPIDNTQPKVLKTNIRKHKRRSKTIDEYPLEFLESTKDKYKTIQEEIEKLKEESKTYERRFSIKRSKTIDEMPTVLKLNTEKENLKHYHPETRDNINKEKNKSNSYPNENVSTTKDNLNPAENEQPSFASELETANKLHKNSNQKTSNKTNKDTSQQKVVKENTTDTTAFLRRSDRSLSKPKRFIEEQPNLLKRNKEKSKISPKTRELFGTDDEDDDDDEVCIDNKNKTKINHQYSNKLKSSSKIEKSLNEKYHKSSSSSSSSSKKKQKREINGECEQDKRDVNKWLSKKKYSSSGNRSISSMFNGISKISTPEELPMLGNKIILEQKENSIEKIKFDKAHTSKNKEVGIL